MKIHLRPQLLFQITLYSRLYVPTAAKGLNSFSSERYSELFHDQDAAEFRMTRACRHRDPQPVDSMNPRVAIDSAGVGRVVARDLADIMHYRNLTTGYRWRRASAE